MDNRQQPIKLAELDRLTLALYMALVVIGWLMIYAVNYDSNDPTAFFDLGHSVGKQLFFIVVCFVLLFFILLSDWTFWRTFAFIFYIFSLFLLIGTIFFGREVNGANAWYQFGGFTFQPAEIAKFATCLAMASYLSATGVNLRDFRSRFFAFGIMLLPILIILLQKDTGSALVFLSFMLVLYREGLNSSWYVFGLSAAALIILGLVFPPVFVVAGLMLLLSARYFSMFRNRLPWYLAFLLLVAMTIWWPDIFSFFVKMTGIQLPAPPLDEKAKPFDTNVFMLIPHGIFMLSAVLPHYFKKNLPQQRGIQANFLILMAASAMVFLANFICFTVLAPHQQERIKVWLRPQECDPRGSLYNILHSKMAIGAGGFWGKGFLEGNMTKLKYVPEQTTDFIFCTVGEEQGFVGVMGIIVIFSLLLYRLSILAERQRSNFSRLYIYSVTGIIFMHFLVNIGMTMGLFPIVGIPLPFISYGGSSLIGFTLMMGVVLKLDSHRNMA